MHATERQRNWAGTYEYGAAGILSPGSVAELQEIVAATERVRAIGTRHSFNDVADGPGTLIDTTGLPADLEIADDRRSVTVSGGIRYGALAVELETAALGLHNMGSLPHISVGGATATGTHGSGTALGSLSTAVRGLEIVGTDGALRRIERGQPDFDGSVVALGALGIVSRVTLDVQPSFRMRQDVYTDLPWAALDGDGLRAIMASGYSVSLFTTWGPEPLRVWLKTRIPEGEADVSMPEILFGATRQPRAAAPDNNITAMDGTVGPWSDRLPHFRVESTPSIGEEIQSESFIDVERAGAALEAVRALGERIRPHLGASELRTVAADDLWLGETQGRESLCIAFTWRRHPEPVRDLIVEIERVLAPFTPRPHWGKMSSFGRDDIESFYPRMRDFRSLVTRHDPGGKFRGPYLERMVMPDSV